MDKVLFNRVACLGMEVLGVFDILGRPVIAHNQQKVRVDFFMDVKDGKLKRPQLSDLSRFLSRNHNLVEQQSRMPWLEPKQPNCIYMDSFAELTDQVFVNKTTNKAFCCTYSDIKHSPEFKGSFEYRGLLPNDQIHDHYDTFFSFIRGKYDVPLTFIHFPAKFDGRESFKKRAVVIKDAIGQLSGRYDIINICADESSVEHARKTPSDQSPYHFARKTVKNIADKLSKFDWIR